MFRIWIALAVFLSCLRVANSQIIEFREENGKKFTCSRTGLSGGGDCGFSSNWYDFVFIGKIATITPIANDENEVQITPLEVFSGSPSSPVTVTTSQALCFPHMSVGDEWLFFLRQEKGKAIVLDYYGNKSVPVASALKIIATFRQLQTLDNRGILRGEVLRIDADHHGHAIASANVTAQRGDNSLFAVATDAEGKFEFQPLEPGRYKIKVDPVGSFQADGTTLSIKNRSCSDISLSRSPHAEISGQIRYSDGTAIAGVTVVLTDENGWITRQSDEKGRFSFDSWEPGKYKIAIAWPRKPEFKGGGCGGAGCGDSIPKGLLYYPNTRFVEDAQVISLVVDEKRQDLDFTVSR